ncbi:MAG: hypothetical protein J6J44_05025 [Lachnospiraceae bacterium]|nr:hypothetical protein [Lachnospiraceae bacterium]
MQPEEFIARLTQLRIKHGVSARDMSLSLGQNAIEQNRCAMACQGCGVVFLLLQK